MVEYGLETQLKKQTYHFTTIEIDFRN